MSGKLQRSSLSKILWVFFFNTTFYSQSLVVYYVGYSCTTSVKLKCEVLPLYYFIKAPLTLYVCPFREICAIGLRTQTVVTSTVWSTKLERGQPFSIMMPRSQSQLKRELWVVDHTLKCRANGPVSNVTSVCLDAALDRDVRALVS